jgi:lipoprotein-anchoring transpeptidase ErfK/SrfK
VNVYKRNRLVHSERAGVGRSVLPTPSGTYFIVSLLKQPNPHGAYGPYAFGLSAYSNVLQSFGGGPGQIGLHGTDNPGGLGTNVSHGCIRIGNAGITRLARMLPLGTRVVIKR